MRYYDYYKKLALSKFELWDRVIIKKVNWHGQSFENISGRIIQICDKFLVVERTCKDLFGGVVTYNVCFNYVDICKGAIRRV